MSKPIQITCLIVGLLFLVAAWPDKPKPGWAVQGRIVKNYDGDTLTFEIRKRVRVRLIDVWAPEVTGSSKPAGIASRDHLRSLSAGKQATLWIPGHIDIKKGITFSRFVGHVWVDGEKKSLNQQQVDSGFATQKKQ